MKPVLVHIHVYYTDMWDELKSYVKNITLPYDLYITLAAENRIMQEDILNLKPDAYIQIVENKGFDIGPFIHVLNQVNLDNYSYLIKIHTKKDWPPKTYLGKYDVSGSLWRKYCLSFLEQENFQKSIAAFNARPELGMVGNFRLILNKELYDVAAVRESKRLLQKVSLPIKPLIYIGGTMFICRAGLLQAVQQLNFIIDDFDTSDKSKPTSLAHTLERFLGWCVKAQGYDIVDPFTPQIEKIRALTTYFLRRIKIFFFRVKIHKDGRLSVKICRIPFPVNMIKRILK